MKKKEYRFEATGQVGPLPSAYDWQPKLLDDFNQSSTPVEQLSPIQKRISQIIKHQMLRPYWDLVNYYQDRDNFKIIYENLTRRPLLKGNPRYPFDLFDLDKYYRQSIRDESHQSRLFLYKYQLKPTPINEQLAQVGLRASLLTTGFPHFDATPTQRRLLFLPPQKSTFHQTGLIIFEADVHPL